MKKNTLIPDLTSKQKKLLSTPTKAGWEEPTLKSAKPKMKKETVKHSPKTLAKFNNVSEFIIYVIKKSTKGSIELCKNKITKQWHYRIKGSNGEILCQSEPMHNRVDLISNLDVVKKIL